jgi:hypothetical protein
MDIREIENRIFVIRDEKVMIDRDLAQLYGVTTKRLNEQVKRNASRFPADFMFRLTRVERTELVAKCDRFEKLKHSSVMPYAYTEHGAVMLASMLNSPIAVHASIQVVRAFVRMRHLLAHDKELARRVEQLEKKVDLHDTDIRLILQDIRKLLSAPEPDLPARDIPKIRGFSKD